MSLAKRRLFSAPMRRPRSASVSLQVTGLEDRTVPAVFTVFNTNDAGVGSLRQAVLQSNIAVGADSIAFDATAFAAAQTISLNGELPVTDSLTVNGTGSNLLTLLNVKAASSSSRVFSIDNSATNINVVLNQMTIAGGNTISETILSVFKNGSGGGIQIGKANVTLNNVIVEANRTAATGAQFSDGGGGIAVTAAGASLTLNSTTIRNNRATSAGADGGGLNFAQPYSLVMNASTISGNTANDDGGGIYGFDGGNLTIVGSTISGNSAGIANTGNVGGGIYTYSSGLNGVVATITNSTISGNSAGSGGAIFAATGRESITLQNSTVTNNASTAGGVGGISRPGAVAAPGKTVLTSSILAGNFGSLRDTQGTVQATNSVIGAADFLTISGGANRTGTEALPLDAKLGVLASNGGPTLTHSLLPGSPAIDAGSNTQNLGADQRGRARVFGIAADAGAYELIPSIITSFTTDTLPGPTNALYFDARIVFNNPTTGLTAANFGLTTTGTAGGTIDPPFTTDNLTWTIRVVNLAGTGAINLSLVNNTGILPGLAATLPLAAPTVLVDHDAPTLLSITRVDPNPTNKQIVAWTVTFDEPVKNVFPSQFNLATGAVPGTTISFVSLTSNAAGNVWTYTADTGSGDGPLQLNFVFGSSNPPVVDLAANILTTTIFFGETYDIDKTAPTILGITRNDPNPTDAAQVTWTVEFSEPVVNADFGSFGLVASTIQGAPRFFSFTGSVSSYQATVLTGTRDVDLRLDLFGSTVTDAAGNALSNASMASPYRGETYNVSREAPRVVSIARANGGPQLTNANEIEWTVRLSKPVTGLSLSNFLLVESNLASNNNPHSTLFSITGSGDLYTIRAATGVNDGDVQLVLENSTNVGDDFGRALDLLPYFGESYTIDRTPPTVTNIVRNGSANTNSSSVSWTVTFSEAVNNFDTSRVVPIVSGALTYASISLVSNNPQTSSSYTVTVDGIVGNGTLGLAIDTTAPLTDRAGNAGIDSLIGFPNTQYVIDQTRPSPIIFAAPSSNVAAFPATISFSEPLVNFGPGGVTVTNGTISGFTQVNPTTYTFTVNAKTAGSVTLSVANGVGVDAVGNPNIASAVSTTNVNPPAPTVAVTASTAGPTNGDVVYTVRFSEAVTGFSPAKIALTNGTVASFVAVNAIEYRFTVTPTADGVVTGSVLAGAGKTGLNVGSLATLLPAFVSDRTKPTVIISRTTGSTDPATSQPVTFTVTFSEAVSGFTASDVALSGTATRGGTATIADLTESGEVYTIIVSGLDGGTITLSIAAGAATDVAGNISNAAANFSRVFSPPVKQFAVGAGRGGISQVINPTGATASQSNYFAATYTAGVRVATGNFSNDGVEDIVIGTGPGVLTNVRIIDGRTGDELFNFQPFEDDFTGGINVAVGDMDGDGISDLLISPDEGGGPRVRGIRGAGFTQLFDFFGIEDPTFRGGARATATDLNGDGRAELVVAAGFGGGPRVTIWDGLKLLQGNTTGSLANFFAFETDLRNGVFVSAGDVDGDGTKEILFGAGPGGGPRVRLFSGGALLTPGLRNVDDVIAAQILDQFGGDVTNRGGIRVLLKDLDGDGRAELITGAGTGAGSRVTAYAGRSIVKGATPTTLFEFDALPGTSSGVYVG